MNSALPENLATIQREKYGDNRAHERSNSLQFLSLCKSLFVSLKWMQWIGLPPSTFGETCKPNEYLRSIDSFVFVTNQDRISIIQNIGLSKILCKPKLR